MFTVELCNAQFATFDPIIAKRQRTPDFNGFNDDISNRNKSCLNYIINLQNEIIALESKTRDNGLLYILQRYYKRLESYKEPEDLLYLLENILSQIPLDLNKELNDYKPKQQINSNTSNSDPVIEMGFSSSYCIENTWNANEKKYDKIYASYINSEFYLTNNTISFKKGSNGWLLNSWSYDSSDKVNGWIIFKDERNQMIYIDNESTMILYLHEYDGENFQKMTAYMNLIRNNNVTPPWINEPSFQKSK